MCDPRVVRVNVGVTYHDHFLLRGKRVPPYKGNLTLRLLTMGMPVGARAIPDRFARLPS